MELVINKLKLILNNEDYDSKYLKEFKEYYESSLKNYSMKCDKCIELENADLPYDCLEKPSYCLKEKDDFEIIKLYEDLKMYVELNEKV